MAKSYKEKFRDEDGVWRTIGGRRVFIRKGQSLSDAMKESGKFKTKITEQEKQNIQKNSDIGNKQQQESYEQAIDRIDKIQNLDERKQAITDYVNKTGTSRDVINDALAEKEYDRHLSQEYDKRFGNKEQQLSDIGDKEEKRIQSLAKMYDVNRETAEKYQYFPKDIQNIKKYGGAGHYDESEFGKKEQQLSDIGNKQDKFYTRKDGTKEYDPYKGTRFEKKYDSVEDRYNKDKNFRDMLKGEHEKTLKATRGEINSYFDMENRDKEIGNKDDLYKMINQYYFSVDRDDFDNLFEEEYSKRFGKKESYEQDVDMNGNDISESKYLKARNEEIRYEKALGEYKDGKDEEEKIKKTGNDYLPKASKVMTAGTSNRKEVSDNIQAHILEYYDNPVDFMEQMDAMDYLPTRWKQGEEIAKGGSYLIYNGDMADYLDSLNINPKGKKFSEDKSFGMYTSLIGRESERLYNRLEKLYDQYKKEHKGSNVSLDDFRKWFK